MRRAFAAFAGLLLVAQFAYAQVPYSVLLVGDSIGAGAGLEKNRQTLQGQLEARNKTWFVFNVSRGGMPVAYWGGWPAFNPSIVGLDGVVADVAVIMLGVNDYAQGSPLDEFKADYYDILAMASFWQCLVVCVTPLWTDHGLPGQLNEAGLELEDYRQAIREVCGAAGAPIVEGPMLVPADPTYFLDGLHPNVRGHRILGKRLSDALRALHSVVP